jgi:uncharacterized protein
MKRELFTYLLKWKEAKDRKPLLVRGARQVGKSYLVKEFGEKCFQSFLSINFEQEREYLSCFSTLYPQKIIHAIATISRQTIVPGKTLLFLDEIQECPNAIRALRYFKEQMPHLHVIGAGSLLEFVLNDADFRMPVGRVESLYLKPISFKEYLLGAGYAGLYEEMSQATLANPLPLALHEKLLNLLHEYFVVGGMPEVVAGYFNTHDMTQVQVNQATILNTYRNDFGKYASKAKHKYLQTLFDKLPGLVGKHFRYVYVDPNIQSRDIKEAVYMLKEAGVVYPIYVSQASGLPLNTFINKKKFKLLFLDIGLVKVASRLDAVTLFSKDLLLIDQGRLAEQLVGQELLAYQAHYLPSELYYWERAQRTSTAEVDYVIHLNEHILPIEVKSGKTGSLKSLHRFLEEKKAPLGLRFSQQPLRLDEKILSIPIYMISELKRLMSDYFNKGQ